jgi:hypothetical protein
LDNTHPDEWTWQPFPSPRNRFDPPSGRFRVRYAANRPAAAARERFVTRNLTEADGDVWLVELSGMPASLHLTRQSVLDALELDDRVSTGRIDLRKRRDPDPLLDTSSRLMDAVYDWWDGAPPPLVYRTRSMPDARSVAFTQHANATVVQAGPLRTAAALHAHLVLRAGFTVPSGWLA